MSTPINDNMEIEKFLNEDVDLLSPEEKEEEKKWDMEFQRRRLDLQRQKTKLKDMKQRSYTRFEDFNSRWRNLEQRRIQRCHLQRSVTHVPSHATRSSGAVMPERAGTTV